MLFRPKYKRYLNKTGSPTFPKQGGTVRGKLAYGVVSRTRRATLVLLTIQNGEYTLTSRAFVLPLPWTSGQNRERNGSFDLVQCRVYEAMQAC